MPTSKSHPLLDSSLFDNLPHSDKINVTFIAAQENIVDICNKMENIFFHSNTDSSKDNYHADFSLLNVEKIYFIYCCIEKISENLEALEKVEQEYNSHMNSSCKERLKSILHHLSTHFMISRMKCFLPAPTKMYEHIKKLSSLLDEKSVEIIPTGYSLRREIENESFDPQKKPPLTLLRDTVVFFRSEIMQVSKNKICPSDEPNMLNYSKNVLLFRYRAQSAPNEFGVNIGKDSTHDYLNNDTL